MKKRLGKEWKKELEREVKTLPTLSHHQKSVGGGHFDTVQALWLKDTDFFVYLDKSDIRPRFLLYFLQVTNFFKKFAEQVVITPVWRALSLSLPGLFLKMVSLPFPAHLLLIKWSGATDWHKSLFYLCSLIPLLHVPLSDSGWEKRRPTQRQRLHSSKTRSVRSVVEMLRHLNHLSTILQRSSNEEKKSPFLPTFSVCSSSSSPPPHTHTFWANPGPSTSKGHIFLIIFPAFD